MQCSKFCWIDLYVFNLALINLGITKQEQYHVKLRYYLGWNHQKDLQWPTPRIPIAIKYVFSVPDYLKSQSYGNLPLNPSIMIL